MAISKLLQIFISFTILVVINLSVAPFHKSSCKMVQLFLTMTGSLTGTMGAVVVAITGILVGGLDGAFVGCLVGDFVGFFVVTIMAAGAFVGGLVATATGAFVGVFVDAITGEFVEVVAFKNGTKFHFGPMYLHPSAAYSVRPGQASSSPALFAGPFPHWTSLYSGRPSIPGPLPRSSQTCWIDRTPNGVSTNTAPISWSYVVTPAQ